MKFNQKLINQLSAGEIILKNEPKNPESALDIIVATGKDRTWFDGQSAYYYKETSGMMYGCDILDLLPKLPIVPISDFLLPENGTITESQTFCGSEKQFEIGKCYEFSNNGEEWIKGTLLAIIDHTAKYVAKDTFGSGRFCMNIREIQSKEVTIERWINMSQSGNQVGKKCYESEIEACQHAPQSQNVFQVKLTGTYTI